MLAEGSLPNPICFHAQQAVEKALKGFLVANGVQPEKTHDLLKLLTACVAFDAEFDAVNGDALYLQQFVIEARYPGDFPSFTLDQARRAYGAAQRIVGFVRERIDRMGADDATA